MLKHFVNQFLAAKLQTICLAAAQPVFFREGLNAALKFHQVKGALRNFVREIFLLVDKGDGLGALRRVKNFGGRPLLINFSVREK